MHEMQVAIQVPIDNELTVVLGEGGGNSGILVSDSLVLVVDSKMGGAMGRLFGSAGDKEFYKQVRRLAGNKPIVLVNTHIHADHAKGNYLYKGETIIAGGNYDKAMWAKENGDENMPTLWVKDSLTFKVGDETVTVLNMPFAAHTQSDVVVYLHNRKLIFTGDLVLNKKNPALFKRYNASSDGYLKAFDLMQQRFDIQTVVPGHGNIGGPWLIENFRQYFKDMQAVANNDPNKDELIDKYRRWTYIPFLMSPSVTAAYIAKEKGK